MLRPSVPCNNIAVDNTISKVFEELGRAILEKNIHDEFVTMVDPNNDFTVKLVTACRVSTNDPNNVDAISGCRFESRQKFMYQLVYVDGGQDLAIAAKTVDFDTIFCKLEPIFEGLCKMQTCRVVHLDIKPDNIVYNRSTGKMALIDFEFACPFSAFSEENQIAECGIDKLCIYPYPYYPGEFPFIGRFIDRTALKHIDLRTSNPNTVLLNTIVDKLVISLGTHFPLSKALRSRVDKLRSEINMEIDMSAYLTDVRRYLPDKVDVYGLGVSIIEVLYISVQSKQTSIYSMEYVYILVVELCTKMVAASPRNRISAQDAKIEYDRIMRLIAPPAGGGGGGRAGVGAATAGRGQGGG